MNNLTASTNAVKDYLYTYTDGHFPFMFTGPLLPSYFSLVKVICTARRRGSSGNWQSNPSRGHGQQLELYGLVMALNLKISHKMWYIAGHLWWKNNATFFILIQFSTH